MNGLSKTFLISSSLLFCACASTKYVPEDGFLLSSSKVACGNKHIDTSEFATFQRQRPNNKLFNLFKTELHIYNLSGQKDSRLNRFLRRIGEAPVVYDQDLGEISRSEMLKEIRNRGYLSASVGMKSTKGKKKIKLRYEIETGEPHIINSIDYDVPDQAIGNIVRAYVNKSLLKKGGVFDANVMNEERQRITSILRKEGYYAFKRENITFIADTTRAERSVDLTMKIISKDKEKVFKPYLIRSISVEERKDDITCGTSQDSPREYNKKVFISLDRNAIKHKTIDRNILFQVGELYDEQKVQRTYSNLYRLSAVKHVDIDYKEKENNELDCNINLTRNSLNSISLSFEGTNSASDYGVAATLGFQNNNLFRGSELFQIKLRTAYESVSGLKQGYSSNSFKEYGVETSLNFPKFLFLFVKHKSIRTNTELGFKFNNQIRPEFTRTLLNASWAYKWANNTKSNHKLDLLNVSYLYLPVISDAFREKYINGGKNVFFAYNYQDRLITSIGYNYYYSSDVNNMLFNKVFKPTATTFNLSVELAGNMMNLISDMFKAKTNESGEKIIFNIPFSQYFKLTTNYLKTIRFDKYNSLSFHLGFGIAVPYGNSSRIPFEKQFFSGGANSVRGWNIRELGPGAHEGSNDLLTKSGEIKLDANIEYRTKLFWKFRGAAFIDAGNIWNIKDYPSQNNGVFRFNNFYDQIAVSYGLGLRLDVDILVLRLDCGLKAINPSYGKTGVSKFPILGHNLKRDFAFHIAVGYPF